MPKVKRSFTIEKKISVIEWHKDNGQNMHKTASEFALDRKTLREWLQKEEALRDNFYGETKKKRKLGCGRKPLSEDLDEELFEFLDEERNQGRAVSNKLLAEKACSIANKIGLDNFKASDRFISNWKRRFGITMWKGTNESQKTPEDLKDEVMSFFATLKRIRSKHDYTLFNIANMDQTMCRFDSPASRTNNLKGDATVRITNTGCKKRGFTVALAARADGTKLPAFCILKEPSGKVPLKVWTQLKIPSNIRVTATKNGWMTAEKLQEWVSRIWGSNDDDVRRLLVLDRASIHTSPACRTALSAVDTDLILIPPGCTMLLQPADVSWNAPFKAKLIELWSSFLRKSEKRGKGNINRPSRQDVLVWVSIAWESVSQDIIATSFIRCGISNALDGSENGNVHENLSRAMQPNSDELETELKELLCDDELDMNESLDGFSDKEDM